MKGEGLWICPRCKRQFERQGQSHSCKLYPLNLHFRGKPESLSLYKAFKKAVKEKIGWFKTESLECCIHFVSSFTFAAVKIMKDKIRVSFTLGRKIKNNRLLDCVHISAHRYQYAVDIYTCEEIDHTLINWVQEALERNPINAEPV